MSITRTTGPSGAAPSSTATSMAAGTGQPMGIEEQVLLGGAMLLAALLLPRPERQDTPIVVSGTGSAEAVGTNTVASVEASILSVSRGLVSFASGFIAAEASAISFDGATSFAAAQTEILVSGADLLLTATRTAAGQNTSASTSWWSETSTTSFFALDVTGLQPFTGPIELHARKTATLSAALPVPDGNAAHFDAAVRVYGDSTLANVSVDAVALQDGFSSVTLAATTASEQEPAPWRDPDALRFGTLGANLITTGSGSDWVFGGGGNDSIDLGAGSNTGFGQGGNDRITAGAEDDWLFGGGGSDLLRMGEGDNIGYGGAGADTISAGAGSDAIDAGQGADLVDAGDGNNTLRLGLSGGAGDGDDRYLAGQGADWFAIAGRFGTDTVAGFRLGQGDRLLCFGGDWDTPEGLAALNGAVATLQRPAARPNDLLFTFTEGNVRSVLVLENFFVLNPEHAATRQGGPLNDSEAVPLLQVLVVDADQDASAADRMAAFVVGDLLSLVA